MTKIVIKWLDQLKIRSIKNSLGKYRPDFIIEDKIIVEIKAVDFAILKYREQLLHYLKAINYKLICVL